MPLSTSGDETPTDRPHPNRVEISVAITIESTDPLDQVTAKALELIRATTSTEGATDG